MQSVVGPDVRIKYFDVPPIDPSWDLLSSEPMRAILEPSPDIKWTDIFVEFMERTDTLLKAAQPKLIDGAIVFSPTPSLAVQTCSLLRMLIFDVNGAYRQRENASGKHAPRRQQPGAALEAFVSDLNAQDSADE